MPKWEYCVLVGVSADRSCGLYTHYPTLYRVTSQGMEKVTNFKNRPKDISEEQATAQMIYQLGEEGWELVVRESFGSTPIDRHNNNLWFKRPK